ncbi:hypothetical protein [Streptomyces sp. NPDC048638]|uniref:hypothetical protein n=1 Tax=Streptomyces sp. NPDC048638 TaxID=3365580 RepID=UPI003710DA69
MVLDQLAKRPRPCAPAGGQGDTLDNGPEGLGCQPGDGRTCQHSSEQQDLAAYCSYLGSPGGL